MLKYVFLCSAIALTGCMASPEKLEIADHQKCTSYGLYRGSPDYARCRMLLDQQRNADLQQRRAIAAQGLQNLSNNLNRQAIANTPRPPVNCVTHRGFDGRLYTRCN